MGRSSAEDARPGQDWIPLPARRRLGWNAYSPSWLDRAHDSAVVQIQCHRLLRLWLVDAPAVTCRLLRRHRARRTATEHLAGEGPDRRLHRRRVRAWRYSADAPWCL